MHSFNTAIASNLLEAQKRLEDFGLSIDQITSVRDSARAAAEDSSPLMPKNAPGTLAYIFGVEALRSQLQDETWQKDEALGIASVINHDLGIRIGFQNVDRACDITPPMPISKKGPASEQICSLSLFDHYGMVLETDKDRLPNEKLKDPLGDQYITYFIMVGQDGSVELSSPIIYNQGYQGFGERIFIDSADEDWDMKIEVADEHVDNFEVHVSIKDA